jgi:uncharacterized membrane protein (DUF106 family)
MESERIELHRNMATMAAEMRHMATALKEMRDEFREERSARQAKMDELEEMVSRVADEQRDQKTKLAVYSSVATGVVMAGAWLLEKFVLG